MTDSFDSCSSLAKSCSKKLYSREKREVVLEAPGSGTSCNFGFWCTESILVLKWIFILP